MSKFKTGIKDLDLIMGGGLAKGKTCMMMFGEPMVGTSRIAEILGIPKDRMDKGGSKVGVQSMVIGIEMSNETIENRIKRCLKQVKK